MAGNLIYFLQFLRICSCAFEKKLNCVKFCVSKRCLGTGIKSSVSGICFAVQASSGLKPLFPLCLADSQNNQKLCVIVLLALENRLEYACFPVPGLTHTNGQVCCFVSSFSFPLLHLVLNQSDEVHAASSYRGL